jgi:hypothetical protein
MKITFEFDEEQYKDIIDSDIEEALMFVMNSKYFNSIKKYIYERLNIADTMLRSIDPLKEGIEIARTQGFRNGALDLLGAMEFIKNSREEKANKKDCTKN